MQYPIRWKIILMVLFLSLSQLLPRKSVSGKLVLLILALLQSKWPKQFLPMLHKNLQLYDGKMLCQGFILNKYKLAFNQTSHLGQLDILKCKSKP